MSVKVLALLEQASILLRGSNPDMLTYIAKLRHGIELTTGFVPSAHVTFFKEGKT